MWRNQPGWNRCRGLCIQIDGVIVFNLELRGGRLPEYVARAPLLRGVVLGCCYFFSPTEGSPQLALRLKPEAWVRAHPTHWQAFVQWMFLSIKQSLLNPLHKVPKILRGQKRSATHIFKASYWDMCGVNVSPADGCCELLAHVVRASRQERTSSEI